MVTLTNKTNRHLEIEDTDGKFIIINSGQTSGELDESQKEHLDSSKMEHYSRKK